MSKPSKKISLDIIAPGVGSSIKVLQVETERLDMHCQLLGKYQQSGDWVALNREHTQLRKTIRALHTNIKIINKMRSMIKRIDLNRFDLLVSVAYGQALVILANTLEKEHQRNFVELDPSEPDLSGRSKVKLPGTDEKVTQSSHPPIDGDQSGDSKSLGGGFWDIWGMVKSSDMSKKIQANKVSGSMAVAVAGGILGGAVLGPLGAVAGVKVAGGLAAVGGVVGSQIGYAGGNMMKKQVDEEDDLKKPLLDDISEKVQKDRCGVKIENDTFSDDKTEEMYTSAKSENNQAEKKDISACKDGSMTGQDDDLFQKQGQECMVKVTGMVVDDKITAHTKYQTTRETRNIEVDQEKQETEKATTASISVENADRAGIEHRQKEEEETCI